MRILYSTGVRLYPILAQIVALFNTKAAKWVKGQKAARKQIAQWKPTKAKTLWVHAASLGEFEMGKPIFESIIERLGSENIHLVITFFSPSGYEIAIKKYKKADLICYLPMDSTSHANHFLDSIQPDAAIFVKYEFWHHYLSGLKKRNIPVFSVGTRFHQEQVFFKWYGKWFVKVIEDFSKVFVQRKDDYQLAQQLGLEKIGIGGDPRYAKVIENAENKQEFFLVEKLIANKPVIVIGSCWEPEEKIVVEFIKKHLTDYAYIIAPHEFKEARLRQFEAIDGIKAIRYSELNENSVNGKDLLLVDKVGDLAQLYQFGDFAFVGGGFGEGLHNILEPLAFGIPTVFGPDDKGFREAQEVVDLGVAKKIKDVEEFEAAVNEFLPEKGKYAGWLKSYFDESMQNIEATVKEIENVLR